MDKDLEQACKQATESIRKGKCNILIIGKTGVGKSTLVNAIFGEEMADARAGKFAGGRSPSSRAAPRRDTRALAPRFP